MGGGSSGGGQTQQQNQYTSLSPWAQPYVSSYLGAAQQQVFNTDPNTGQITGVNPYQAYGSINPAGGQYGMSASDQSAANASVAGFTPLQQQQQQSVANLQTPGQYRTATNLTNQAGAGALGTTQTAAQYGQQGSMAGQMGAGASNLYGAMGANTGQQYAGQSLGYGQQGSQIGQQAAALGASATPQDFQNQVGGYMNPYINQALAPSMQLLNQQYGMQGAAEQGAATSAGAFGGSREALMQGLNQQNQMLAQNQLVGNAYNNAFTAAQNQYNQAGTFQMQGLQNALTGNAQGLQGANQAGSQALQGYGLGLSGAQQAGNLGIAGANAGLAGVGAQQSGYGLAGTQGQNLANIGTQQLGAQQNILNMQGTVGGQQQQQQQNIINQGMQNYQTAQQYPMTQLGQLKNLISGTPITDVTTTQQAAAPTVFGQIAPLAGAAAAGVALANGKNAATGGIMKAKRFDSGGIAAINRKVMLAPDKYSKQTIDRGMQDGTISKPAGGIAEAIQLSEQADSAPKTPPPTSTVVDDLKAKVAQVNSAKQIELLKSTIEAKLEKAVEEGHNDEAHKYAADLAKLDQILSAQQGGAPAPTGGMNPASPAQPQGISQAAPPQPAPQQPPQGIDQAPSNLPTQMAAEGGVMRLAGGTKKDQYEDTGLPDFVTGMPTQDYQTPSATKLSRPGLERAAGMQGNRSDIGYTPKSETAFQYIPGVNRGASVPKLSQEALARYSDPAVQDVLVQKGIANAFANNPTSTKPTDTGIVIHDTPVKAIEGAPATPSTTTASPLSYLSADAPRADTSGVTSLLNKYEKMINDNAEDPEKARSNAMLMRLIQGAMGAAGKAGKVEPGKVQTAFSSWAEGAEPAFQGYMSDIDKINTAKNDKVKQLLALGLTGEQLKMEAEKLGISKAELPVRIAQANAQIADVNNKISETPGINDLRAAQAYQARKTGDYMKERPRTSAAGLGGGISNEAYLKLEAEYDGYKAMPSTAPFFQKLPAKVQDGLTNYGPKTSTYIKAKKDFDSIADQYMDLKQKRMSAANRKSAAPTSELANPFE
jgi:hypothetical protein